MTTTNIETTQYSIMGRLLASGLGNQVIARYNAFTGWLHHRGWPNAIRSLGQTFTTYLDWVEAIISSLYPPLAKRLGDRKTGMWLPTNMAWFDRRRRYGRRWSEMTWSEVAGRISASPRILFRSDDDAVPFEASEVQAPAINLSEVPAHLQVIRRLFERSEAWRTNRRMSPGPDGENPASYKLTYEPVIDIFSTLAPELRQAANPAQLSQSPGKPGAALFHAPNLAAPTAINAAEQAPQVMSPNKLTLTFGSSLVHRLARLSQHKLSPVMVSVMKGDPRASAPDLTQPEVGARSGLSFLIAARPGGMEFLAAERTPVSLGLWNRQQISMPIKNLQSCVSSHELSETNLRAFLKREPTRFRETIEAGESSPEIKPIFPVQMTESIEVEYPKRDVDLERETVRQPSPNHPCSIAEGPKIADSFPAPMSYFSDFSGSPVTKLTSEASAINAASVSRTLPGTDHCYGELTLALAPTARARDENAGEAASFAGEREAVDSSQEAGEATILDPETLALEVYAILKRRFLVEQERSQGQG